MIRVHGAGFAHGLLAFTRGIMVELKTHYGWTEASMPVISDARLHTHVIIGTAIVVKITIIYM